jgi:gas vesicle protein
MSNKRAVIAAFLVGAIISGASAYFFYSRQIKELNLHRDISSEIAISQERLVNAIKTLKDLRSGDVTNAIIFCENLVDSSVVSLAGQVTEGSKWYPFSTNDLALENDFAMSAIEHAKKYRDKFPYKSGDDFNTDKKVASAFALVNVQTNH